MVDGVGDEVEMKFCGVDTSIRGPYSWAELSSVDSAYGPVLLDGGHIVYEDTRTDGNLWVPYYLRNFDLLTSIHADTYVAGSPPTGWAESVDRLRQLGGRSRSEVAFRH